MFDMAPKYPMNHNKWCGWFVRSRGKGCTMMFRNLTHFTLEKNKHLLWNKFRNKYFNTKN